MSASIIVIAGASGLLGRALTARLRAEGRTVRRLVRHEPASAEEIFWNPMTGDLDAARLDGAEAVVNLAGANIAAGRWTAVRRREILASRVASTRTLVGAMARAPVRPRVFVCASATGIYGDCGEAVVDEGAALGTGFLAEVCAAWEREAVAAEPLGVRTVRLRFGVVLARDGGALAKLLPLFRAGLGGRVGNGRQWMSWVTLADAVMAVAHAADDARCTGALNVAAPEAVTNIEFTATLARVLRRPAFLPAPAWAVRAVFGAMADETVLASTRATPARLLATGFEFGHPGLENALRHTLKI